MTGEMKAGNYRMLNSNGEFSFYKVYAADGKLFIAVVKHRGNEGIVLKKLKRLLTEEMWARLEFAAIKAYRGLV